MRRTLFSTFLALIVAFTLACPATAQKARHPRAKPKHKAAATTASAPRTLTALQIMERSIAASSGKASSAKRTSSVMKGTLTIPGQGLNGTIEVYSKAPNKQVSLTDIGGLIKSKQGFDGSKAWASDNLQGTRVLEGVEGAVLRRSAVFDADAKWRELWKSIELATPQPVAGKPTYALKMIPKDGEGQPMTVYFDTETFLPVRSDLVQEGPTGTVPVTTLLSDYRLVDGVQIPFALEQQVSVMSMKVVFTDVKFNVPIDDAMFEMPKQ